MRFCWGFGRLQKFARTENRPQLHAPARQSLRTALLAVDDANRRGHVQMRLAERREQVGPRLEAILVQVVAGAFARAQEEVALEVRRVADREPELVVCQEPRVSP